MDTRTKEAVRYLGYGNHAVDENTLTLIECSFARLEQVVKRRIICRTFGIYFLSDSHFMIGQLDIKSKNLGRNLKNCQSVVLLGATLGAEVDLLIRRSSLDNMAGAVTLQACAAALLEEYLDEWQEQFRIKMEAEGVYLRPRFSPGYGDFSIGHQEMILRMLDTAKMIGLTMTDGGMLTPTKSVTAVIGLSQENTPCHRQGCEACSKRDCAYRRN